MPWQSQFFANVRCRKQRKIVASGTNCLHALGSRKFEHRLLVAEICEYVFVGVWVAETAAVISCGNYVPAQRLCGLNQRNFGMTSTEEEKFISGLRILIAHVQLGHGGLIIDKVI